MPTYTAAFARAEAAVRAGEAPGSILNRELCDANSVGDAMAVLLAVTDAKRAVPPRKTADVCHALHRFCHRATTNIAQGGPAAPGHDDEP